MGFTVSGQSRECIIKIPVGSGGAYTYYENSDEIIPEYVSYWYTSQLGTRYVAIQSNVEDPDNTKL